MSHKEEGVVLDDGGCSCWPGDGSFVVLQLPSKSLCWLRSLWHGDVIVLPSQACHAEERGGFFEQLLLVENVKNSCEGASVLSGHCL